MTGTFAQRLKRAAFQKDSRVVAGLDPRWDWTPGFLLEEARRRYGATMEAVAWAIARFNEEIIAAVAPAVVAVKVQLACYLQYGVAGLQAMEATLACARAHGLLTILDGKFNDIASSAEAYAAASLGRAPFWDGEEVPAFDADAVTVNPYLGRDGLLPFLETSERWGKGFFVLARTSNPSAGDLQDLPLDPASPKNPGGARSVLEAVANMLEGLNEGRKDEDGYGPVGAVVGATYPREAAWLRTLMPSCLFLLPGYGAQGAGAQDVVGAFDENGWGAVVNSSRAICYAYRTPQGRQRYPETQFAQAAREAAEAMRQDIAAALARR